MKQFLVSGNRGAFPDILFLVLSLRKSQEDSISLSLVSADFSSFDSRYQPLSEKQYRYLETLLQEKNPASRLIFHDVSERGLHDFPYLNKANRRYTPYAYLRLYADSLYDGAEPVLYLDTDTVVLQDLTSLFQTDLANHDLGIVVDPVGSRYYGKNYGNSGVLLLNLPQIRVDGSFQKCREFIAGKAHGYSDQNAINLYCSKTYLNEKYNEQSELKSDTAIRHYPRFFYLFPYPHDVIIRPSTPAKFRARYPQVHEELLEEYESLWPSCPH